MKIALAFSCLLAIGLAMPTSENDEWENYKQTYGKTYTSKDVEGARRAIYFQNKERVEEHNDRYKKGLVSFGVKLNHLADLLTSESKQLNNGYKMATARNGQVYHPRGSAPASVDWRNKGVVTGVKNQQQCGSCWAFSTTGSLEGQHALKTGNLVSLSEQQLVDCSQSEGNEGCNGGLMDYGFEYIKDNGGIDTESSYPYTAEDGRCHFNKKTIGATVSGYVDIQSGSESDLLNAAANVGPIAVAIDASNWSFQLYSEGVYDEESCSSDMLDHGVLVVGYGEQNNTPYWLVKNSWGADWGQDGYILMSRNKDNQCGISTQASYPLV